MTATRLLGFPFLIPRKRQVRASDIGPLTEVVEMANTRGVYVEFIAAFDPQRWPSKPHSRFSTSRNSMPRGFS